MAAARSIAVALVAACVASGALTAQHLWIVAPAGGDFTDLQTAINAATPGDTLLVRGGAFGVVYVDRSLQIVGDQPRPTVTFLSCWAGTTVALSAIDANTLQFGAGLVACEDVTSTSVALAGTKACFVRCRFDARNTGISTTSLTGGSRAVFDGCQLFGSPGLAIQTLTCTPYLGASALTVAAGCVAEVGNSTLTGAPPTFLCGQPTSGTSGLTVQPGATVSVSRSTVQAGGPAAAVVGSGAVLADGSTFVPGFAASAAFLPIVTGQGAAPGAAMTVTLRGVPSQPAILAYSIGQHAPVALPEGIAWVDLAFFWVLAFGVTDGTGALPFSVPVPNGIPRGLVVTFQGIAPNATSTVTVTTPALLHVL